MYHVNNCTRFLANYKSIVSLRTGLILTYLFMVFLHETAWFLLKLLVKVFSRHLGHSYHRYYHSHQTIMILMIIMIRVFIIRLRPSSSFRREIMRRCERQNQRWCNRNSPWQLIHPLPLISHNKLYPIYISYSSWSAWSFSPCVILPNHFVCIAVNITQKSGDMKTPYSDNIFASIELSYDHFVKFINV